MRRRRVCTSGGVALLALLATMAAAAENADYDHPARLGPNDPSLAAIDAQLEQGRCAQALRALDALATERGDGPALQIRRAQAHFQSQRYLGAAEERTFVGGRVGQFREAWLLVKERGGPDRFLACPPESALYQVRLALRGGGRQPAAELLHARIWQRLGRLELAAELLRAATPALLAEPREELLRAGAALAGSAGDRETLLRLARAWAEHAPSQRAAIMADAYRQAADISRLAGEARACASFLRRAAALRPDDDALCLQLADAEWDAGRSTAAETLYRRVLTVAPDHAEAGRIRARLAEIHADAPPTNSSAR